MRAVRIHAKQDMRTEQVPSPEPDDDEVRLRVGYVGICGSDLHYYADGAAGIFAIRDVPSMFRGSPTTIRSGARGFRSAAMASRSRAGWR